MKDPFEVTLLNIFRYYSIGFFVHLDCELMKSYVSSSSWVSGRIKEHLYKYADTTDKLKNWEFVGREKKESWSGTVENVAYSSMKPMSIRPMKNVACKSCALHRRQREG